MSHVPIKCYRCSMINQGLLLQGNFGRSLGVHFVVVERIILVYNADILQARLIFLELNLEP